MKAEKQSGFGSIGIFAILVTVGLVGFAGWYVYQVRSKSVVKSYQECVNKGYPVLQTYPEQCKSPDGKLFTNPTDIGNPPNMAGLAVLSGTVTEGPTTPVCRQNVPCTAVVSNHMLNAESTSGKVVVSTKTNSNGKYMFYLKPGHYKLVLVPEVGMFTKDSEVDVVAGTNSFDLFADTGIR